MIGLANTDSITSSLAGSESIRVAEFLQRKEKFGFQRNTLRKIFAKAFLNAAGTPQKIKIVPFGDSLAVTKVTFLQTEINSLLGIGSGDNSLITESPTTIQCASEIISGTYETNEADGYAYWPTGPLYQIANGSVVKFTYGGVNPTFTSLVIYYVKEPGAGTMDVEMDDVVVQSIDADNVSVQLGKYEYTQSLAQKKVEIVGTGGNIRIIGVYRKQSTAAVEIYPCSSGGLPINSAMSSSQARALMAEWMDDISLDLFTFEMDDNGGTQYESDLGLLGDIIDSCSNSIDCIFIASTPAASNEKTAQRNSLEKFCYNRNYHFFDGNTPVAPYATLVDLGWNGDGTHPTQACHAYLSGLMIRQFGIDGWPYRINRFPNRNTGTRSLFAKDSGIHSGTGNAGTEFTFTTDGFGYDWKIVSPRTTTMNVGGYDIFQIGNGVLPNVFPTNWNWYGSNAKSVSFSGNVLTFVDTDRANDAQEVSMGALKLVAFTKATAPNPLSYSSFIIYISDGGLLGEGVLAYSRGESNWRRVSDDTAIT